MYNEYFGLEETPFSIAPDPRYIYMSDQHREALAHLIYGFNSTGGFVLLTGDVGTGKTTICRCLLEQIPDNSSIAFIFNPKLTVEELLATVCDEFGITYNKGSSSIKEYVDLINYFLLQTHSQGVKAVLIIDEAQNLSTEVLEQLRLLTNLETNQHKLLHVILLGQPELGLKLSKPELSQLSQRIIARYHLGPLSKKDVGAYVNHRLKVAGIHKQLFSAAAINKLYRFTGGVPRLINVICDRALLGTFTKDQERVTRSTLSRAANEVFGDRRGRLAGTQKRAIAWALMTIVIVAFGIALASNYISFDSETLSKYVGLKQEPEVIDGPDNVKSPDTDATIRSERFVTAADITSEPADPGVSDDINRTAEETKKQSEGLSYTSMFKLWNIDHKPRNFADACSSAEKYGLTCMTGFKSMKSLKKINRPAVLKLFDTEGNSYYVTLIALGDDTARIRFGNEEKTVDIEEVESQWFGHYTLFWRPPEDYKGTWSLYDGSAVKWLRKNIAVINKTQLEEPDSMVYDSDLVREIKKFQVAEGLKPDGVAGPLTMIHINTVLDSSVPTLTGPGRMN
ncbi:MAG: AAA family ATPase [Nitrospiraceae bacterium]|nr:MAG: AAA family ATPase [Nitrospiraceae bacterium]